MILLPYSRPWEQPPQTGAELNPAFSSLLLEAGVGTEQNLKTGRFSTLVGLTRNAQSILGPALKGSGSASEYVTGVPSNSRSFALLAVVVPNSVTSFNFIADADNGIASRRRLQLRLNGSDLEFIRFNTAVASVAATVSGAAAIGVPLTVLAWSDELSFGLVTSAGSASATLTGTASTWDEAPEWMARTSNHTAASTYGSNSWLVLRATFSSALSQATRNELVANPYQVFAPQRIWVPVSVASGAYTLTAAKGTFSLTGNAATLTAARTVAAAKGTFTLTGSAATFARGYAMTAARGQFALTGNAATFVYARAIVAAKGAFALTGNDATLTYTPAGVTYTLPAARGTFTLTGQAAALSQPARVMSAAAGAFTLDGKAATLQIGSGMAGRRGRRTKTRFLPPAEPEAQQTPEKAEGLVSEEAMTLLIQDQAGKAIRKARVSATKRRLEIQNHNVKALESTLMEWF